MRFPVFDFRRNGKSHMPGSAASVPTATLRKKPEVLFNPTVCRLCDSSESPAFAPKRLRRFGGGRKAEGGKHFNCRVNCMSAADRRLLMPAGHLLFCATKKVAGNAIPRSRLPSEREIAHARVSNLCTYFGYKVRHRKKYFFKPTVIFHSGRTSGRPPRACEGCGPPVGRRPARPLTRKLIF